MNQNIADITVHVVLNNQMRDRDYFEDISGIGLDGRPKAHVILR